jgi:hypothetical protein
MLWSSYILPKNSMMPEYFKITLSRALRCNLFPARQNCPLCSKHVPADSFGDHYLSCPTGGGLTRRHNRLRDIARTVAVEGSTPCKPEPLHLLLHSDKKPAELLFPLSTSFWSCVFGLYCHCPKSSCFFEKLRWTLCWLCSKVCIQWKEQVRVAQFVQDTRFTILSHCF